MDVIMFIVHATGFFVLASFFRCVQYFGVRPKSILVEFQTESRAHCYKTFYVRILMMLIIS